jgi:Domain of unknown function (DUF4260)
MLSKPGALLRVEGAFVFALSVFLYHLIGARWWIFVLLFLWPDLFMLGYAVSVRIGSSLYNLVHTYFLPVALAGVSLHEHKANSLSFALIWVAHIGLDRALGYGLKYPTFFKDTHLQRVNEASLALAEPQPE